MVKSISRFGDLTVSRDADRRAARLHSPLTTNHSRLQTREAPSLAGSPERAMAVTKSLPGMCGKPRKLTVLANLARQVANCLSQPAGTPKVSPGPSGWAL